MVKSLNLIRDLWVDIIMSRKPKIFIVGLPRTGTTWIASVLNTAKGIKYFYEPFNDVNLPKSTPHLTKYLTAADDDREFASHCHDAFSGRVNGHYVRTQLSRRYKKFRWWPGRVMVKDVHSYMALEWIDWYLAPTTLIVIRHPCAVAASWLRLNYQTDMGIQRLLAQPKLINDYLKPFKHHLCKAVDFFQQMGAYWGATYYVILRQKQLHPGWIVVQHEEVCRNPERQFRELFDKLDLSWTTKTDELLRVSTTNDSNKPYVPQRISHQEPDKWKKELNLQQIEQVMQFIKPFSIPYYNGI